MLELRTILRPDGRIVLPAECRRALQITAGDELIIKVHDGEATIFGIKHALEQAQKKVRQFTGGKKNLVKELTKLRRTEAKNE